VKSVTYEEVPAATIWTSQTVHFENMQNICFFPLFLVVELSIKFKTAISFCFWFWFVLHLNILAKHNK
jgi:hypothetical protein